MSKLAVLLALVSSVILSPMAGSVLAQSEESAKYEIIPIKTAKQKYGDNYYSYNFAVLPVRDTIDRIKVAVISDLETKYAETENDISPPYSISFGVMIHAMDPDKIRYEVIEIITK